MKEEYSMSEEFKVEPFKGTLSKESREKAIDAIYRAQLGFWEENAKSFIEFFNRLIVTHADKLKLNFKSKREFLDNIWQSDNWTFPYKQLLDSISDYKTSLESIVKMIYDDLTDTIVTQLPVEIQCSHSGIVCINYIKEQRTMWLVVLDEEANMQARLFANKNTAEAYCNFLKRKLKHDSIESTREVYVKPISMDKLNNIEM